MYVAKELALILKEKGWNCGSDKDWYYGIQSEEVLDWIFKQVFLTDGWIPSYYNPDNSGCEPDAEPDFNEYNEWYLFWYKTLLEHKFSLMYEFIGRLEEWFESNNLYPISYLLTQGWQSDIHILISKELDEMEVINLSTYWDTKQQAKHEAIMKCFELLKENTNGSI